MAAIRPRTADSRHGRRAGSTRHGAVQARSPDCAGRSEAAEHASIRPRHGPRREEPNSGGGATPGAQRPADEPAIRAAGAQPAAATSALRRGSASAPTADPVAVTVAAQLHHDFLGPSIRPSPATGQRVERAGAQPGRPRSALDVGDDPAAVPRSGDMRQDQKGRFLAATAHTPVYTGCRILAKMPPGLNRCGGANGPRRSPGRRPCFRAGPTAESSTFPPIRICRRGSAWRSHWSTGWRD
jgi:hypothetical protein